MVDPNRVTLVLASIDHLEALQESREAFAEILGSPVPDGWPAFPEAVEFTLSRLRRPGGDDGWSMHFFVDAETGVLIGSGGYVSAPDENGVEIGYEIAPIFRSRGLGTAAAAALVANAEARGVAVVTAHTLPEDGGSTRILTSPGIPTHGRCVRPRAGCRVELGPTYAAFSDGDICPVVTAPG